MMQFTIEPADDTACLRIQVKLQLRYIVITPADGILTLHLDIKLQPRVRTPTLVKHNQPQHA